MHYPFIIDRELGETLTPNDIVNKAFNYIAKKQELEMSHHESPTEETKEELDAFNKEPFNLELLINGLGTHNPELVSPIFKFDEHGTFFYEELNVPDAPSSTFRKAVEQMLSETLDVVNSRNSDSCFTYRSHLPNSGLTKFIDRVSKIYDQRSMPVSKAFGMLITRILKDRNKWGFVVSDGVSFDTFVMTFSSDYFTLHVSVKENWHNDKVIIVVTDFKFEIPNYHAHSNTTYPTKTEFLTLLNGMYGLYIENRHFDFNMESKKLLRQTVVTQNTDYFANALIALDRREKLQQDRLNGVLEEEVIEE